MEQNYRWPIVTLVNTIPLYNCEIHVGPQAQISVKKIGMVKSKQMHNFPCLTI